MESRPLVKSKVPCAVPGCKDWYSKRHYFPKDPSIFLQWIIRLNNPKFANKTRQEICAKRHAICDLHFEDDCKVQWNKKIKRGTLPTLKLPSYPCEEPIDVMKVWPGGCITDLPPVQPEHSMVEDYEILRDLSVYNAKSVDIPDIPYTTPWNHISDPPTPIAWKPPKEYLEEEESDEEIEVRVSSPPCNISETREATKKVKPKMTAPKLHQPIKTYSRYNNVLKAENETCEERICSEETKIDEPEEVLEELCQFKSIKNSSRGDEVLDVCRVCFCPLLPEEMIMLYDENSDSIRLINMLKLVLPDLDLGIYSNPVMCAKCVEQLISSYQFREKWLLTEDKLQQIIEKQKDKLSRDVDLVIKKKQKTVKHNHKAYLMYETPYRPKRSDFKWGPGPHLCEICGRLYLNKGSMIKHLRIHRCNFKRGKVKKPKPAKSMCEICGEFFSLGKLRWHKLRHRHREFKCSKCDRIFNCHKKIAFHMRYHHLRRGAQCHLCGKHFASPGYLKIHILLHNPPKRYPCKICNKKFACKTYLRRHMICHQGNNVCCDLCGKSMKREESILEHKKVFHWNQAKYVCEFCEKPYWKEFDLKRHRIKIHGWTPNVKPNKVATSVAV